MCETSTMNECSYKEYKTSCKHFVVRYENCIEHISSCARNNNDM